MTRTAATNRQNLKFSLNNKTVLDTFASDGFTKSGSGSPLGTWSVDAVDTYNGRSTLKLVTSGTGTGVRDYAIKTLSSPVNFDFAKDYLIFELIAKVNDINKVSRFYLDLFVGPATTTPDYYNIIFEGTGNKWGFNNEYEIFRGSFHQVMNSVSARGNIKGIRLQVSDSGTPIIVNYAQLSVYKIPTKRAYLVFTNDDGTKSGYDFMHSVMQPLGLTGTAFPSRENIASGEGGSSSYANHANLLQLESDGFEIGIHGESGSTENDGTTISFDAASREIRDSANGFIDGGYLPGNYIIVKGSTKNNGKYLVESVAAGVLVVEGTLTDEAAGASVTTDAEGFDSYTPSTLGAYIDTQIAYLRDTVGVSSALDTIAYPNGVFGKDSNSFPYTEVASRFRLARVTHEQNTECLVINDPLRVHAGKNMYFSSSNSVTAIKNSISNLLAVGGIGIIVSHSIIESASTSYNYNLTDATTVMTYIKSLVDAGRLQVIKFGDIDKIAPVRSAATNRVASKQNYEISPGTLFEGFESTTGWSTSPNAPEKLILETSDIKEGSGAIKLVSSSSSNNQMGIKTISKLFTDSDGYLSFYVKPSTNVDSIVLGFTSATSFASVYMGYTLSTTNMFVNKWNFVRIKLSNFTATGGDSFANLMIRMRIRVVSSNASEATAIFDNLRYGTWSRPKIILQSDNAANLSIINTMYPILTTAGMKATLYVQSNVIGVANKLTLANLQTLYGAGWDLGNHTNGHENLTTATIADAQTTVETCETFLRDNGFSRGLGHIAYPEGATNDTVNAMLSGIGFKTGRKATDKPQIVPMADPYKLEAYTLKAADSLATMKSYVDAAINGGKTSIIMIEGLADSSPAAQEILTSDYQSLVDYIKAYKDQGVLDVVTISEWYNGLTSPRRSV